MRTCSPFSFLTVHIILQPVLLLLSLFGGPSRQNAVIVEIIIQYPLLTPIGKYEAKPGGANCRELSERCSRTLLVWTRIQTRVTYFVRLAAIISTQAVKHTDNWMWTTLLAWV